MNLTVESVNLFIISVQSPLLLPHCKFVGSIKDFLILSQTYINTIKKSTILDTHHHFGTAAETFSIVISGNNLKLEVGPAHVSKHDGRLDDTRVGLNDEAVLALLCRWDNQAVCHLAVIPSVLVSGL